MRSPAVTGPFNLFHPERVRNAIGILVSQSSDQPLCKMSVTEMMPSSFS